jgi:hypothetical protein
MPPAPALNAGWRLDRRSHDRPPPQVGSITWMQAVDVRDLALEHVVGVGRAPCHAAVHWHVLSVGLLAALQQ